MTINNDIPEAAKIIYFHSVPEKGQKVEIMREESIGAVTILLKLGENESIFTAIKNDRMYCPKPAHVFMGGEHLLEFYKNLFPYGRVNDFDVVFSFDNELFSVPIERFMASVKHTLEKDSLLCKILVSLKDIDGHKLFSERRLVM